MTQEWIEQFNKKCAVFLGAYWCNDDLENFPEGYWMIHDDLELPLHLRNFQFHSDWNWIMEVFEYILELPKKYDGNFWELNGKVFSIKHMMFHEIIGEKETVIQKIDNFIDWYNKQKAVGNETVKKDS